MPERETAKDVFEAMQRYQDDVYRAALMATGNFADAEDILQDVFLKYYQSHPVFASPSHEKAWLLRCAINAGHDLRRSIWVSRRADAELDSASGVVAVEIPGDGALYTKDLKKLFPKAVREQIADVQNDGTIQELEEKISAQAKEYFNAVITE